MKPKIAKDPGASVRARLLAHTKATGDDFQRILTRYAIERLLFRLSQSDAKDRFVLKGAMLFVTWPDHVHRPTGDLDLLSHGAPDPDTLKDQFTRICHVEVPDDGILFDPATLQVEPVREEDKYQGAQLSLRASLATAQVKVLIDIGFGDHVFPRPKRESFPTLLPDLPAANILMYPPETVIAEKFEAMIRFAETNSRIKDFYDIWVTTRTFEFDLPSIVEAVGGTLRRRGTAIPTEMPIGLSDVFAEIVAKSGLWTAFLRRTPAATKPPQFPQLLADLRRFFEPVIACLRSPEGARGRWEPTSGAWR